MKAPDPTAWFHESRYGMFLHWGPYSVAGRGEWVANRERLSQEDYSRLYAQNFRAENYEPIAWAALAKEAGMGYGVLTTRHHDGFALWPTKTSDFHAGKIGPGRDLVGPFVEAFRAAGLKVGLYFSPADWYHPDYPGPHFRDWPDERDWRDDAARDRFIAYYRAQLRELLTSYGRIDYLWYDGCIPADLRTAEANDEALRLQPHLLINERNGPPSHVQICEQAIKPAPLGIPWEACMTLNETWGYHAGDTQWKSARQVVDLLTKTAAGAGNLLLNIGPRADGSIPAESIAILREAGHWLKHHREAISNSSRSPFTWNNWGTITTRDHRLYLHLAHSPGTELRFAELKNRVLHAYWMENQQVIQFEQRADILILRGLPEPLPGSLPNTIVLEVDGPPETITAQTNFWIPGE